ncbi:uncharacterized protein LOC120707366 [Panicum virgatum]|uniref:uncharacterized protein LOC120707366 n=1 Tax=Panicum virgatum TaxID=38727 RepID=UPI0019D585BB|nr:uncharacterized protein LOC120707366 [Panicum virgatum]
MPLQQEHRRTTRAWGSTHAWPAEHLQGENASSRLCASRAGRAPASARWHGGTPCFGPARRPHGPCLGPTARHEHGAAGTAAARCRAGPGRAGPLVIYTCKDLESKTSTER